MVAPKIGSGSSTSGSLNRKRSCETISSASVHVGNRSAPGGKNAQGQPASRISVNATTRSSALSSGEIAPSNKCRKRAKPQRIRRHATFQNWVNILSERRGAHLS